MKQRQSGRLHCQKGSNSRVCPQSGSSLPDPVRPAGVAARSLEAFQTMSILLLFVLYWVRSLSISREPQCTHTTGPWRFSVRETSPHFCWVLGAEEQQSSCWLIAEQGKPFAFSSSDSSETTFYREEGRQDLSLTASGVARPGREQWQLQRTSMYSTGLRSG